jgi:hypothetical protein
MATGLGGPDNRGQEEWDHLANKLRVVVVIVVLLLLVGLVLFDVVDDTCLGGHYPGPPGWLVEILRGILVALFGGGIFGAVAKWANRNK